MQLTDYFDGIVNPAELKKGKPDPEIYLEAAKSINLQPNQVAGIEDAQAGIASINAAGELSIGIGESLKDADIDFATTNEMTLAAIEDRMV